MYVLYKVPHLQVCIAAEKALAGLERKTGYLIAFADSMKEISNRTRFLLEMNNKTIRPTHPLTQAT